MLEKINPQVFLKIAETGSFRKAADALGYTQAGVSYIINSMENEIGFSVFIREHDGVKLTTEGEMLLPHMRQYVNWKHSLEQTVNEINGLEKGLVRVQIFNSVSVHWIPGIIKRFNDDYPNVKIELITEEDSFRAEEMVMNGEVDCGFFLTDVKSEIDSFKLCEETIYAVVSPDHPAAQYDKFPLSMLDKYPYICMKYGEHTGINKIFYSQGLEPLPAFSMDNDNAAMSMASNGLGYCIFAELVLENIPYNVKKMEFDKPQTRVISVGTKSIRTCSKACLKFIEYTREWVREYLSSKQKA